MITLLTFILLFSLFVLFIRLTWGITKIAFSVICLPLILVCWLIGGVFHLLLPVLIVYGIIRLFSSPRVV